MAISLISVKCPDCGATLNIEEGRTQVFCSYCGANVLVRNENEHVFRHIDEAGIARAEVDREVQLKQLEMAQEKQQEARRNRSVRIGLGVLAAALGIVMMVAGGLLGGGAEDALFPVGFLVLIGASFLLFFPFGDDDDVPGDKAKVPDSIEGYERKHYRAIEVMFKAAGFTNVTSVPLQDLTVGLFVRPGMVESITVNGHQVYAGGRKFPKDAPVVISFHSLIR